MPPISLRQFRISRKGGAPVAHACWARLTEEAETRVVTGQVRLQPAEWNAGDRLWLIEGAAPFGGTEAVLNQLRGQVFEGQQNKTLQPAPDGSGVVVMEW